MKFADRIRALFGRKRPEEADFFEDLADLLVEGDLGAALAMEVSDELKTSCRKKGVSGESAIIEELKDILFRYGKEVAISPEPGKLSIFLMLGVNGVGKTTTAAKLAKRFLDSGASRKAILAAGDTFRAAAIDQLVIHGERLGIRVVAQQPGSDPGAVLFDAIEAAKAEGADLVIADSAGRMHTRQDLVRELGKIDRIIASRASSATYRRLLVLDATTGQNGLRQAEVFGSAVPVDGIVLTKYDSSAKGGIVLALAKDLGLPTAFLGTGEGYGDLRPFRLEGFLDEFLGIGQ